MSKTNSKESTDLRQPDGWPRWLWRRVRLLWRAPLAHREAVLLAQVMWRRSYRDSAPHWQPFEDTAGVISQINNMHAGVVEENERMRAALQAVRCWYDRDGSVGGCENLMEEHVEPLTYSPNNADEPRPCK